MTWPTWLEGSGPMHDFALALVYTVGTVFLLLVVVIVVGKGWREIVEARLRRRRVELEPAFFKYVVGRGPIERYLPRPLRPSERVLVEEIFFDVGRVVKG